NLKYLPEMVELAYTLGATAIICGEIMLSGRAAENKELLMNEEERNLLYDTIEILQKEYLTKMEVRYSVPENVSLQTKGQIPNKTVIVRPDGNVRLDCTAPFVIGNVLNSPFTEIWQYTGINAWNHPLVQDYIMKDEASLRDDPVNHVKKDILLS
ncbi:MAG: hypothetical protein Q4F84_10345, partial [Fibrobacter sp.]|nr:hypothetical protein [Fibrobacter sp.]